MKVYRFNIQRLAYLFIVLYFFMYLLVVGKSILVPLAFAIVLSLMTKPLCNRVESKLTNRAFAIALSFIIVLVPLISLLSFFYIQSIEVFYNIDSISDKIQDGVGALMRKVNHLFGLSRLEGEELLTESSSSLMEQPLSLLGATLSVSSAVILNIFLTFVYTFLLLLYRGSIKQFYLIQFGDRIKEGAEDVLNRIQNIVQRYLYGLCLVMGILGVLNSIGLLCIGLEYAVFWGFLAAFLAVIPYVGTVLGGLIPLLYSLATADSYFQPTFVLLWFILVQVIEGNLITPKVVGSSIKINPLVSILSVIIGGSIWGAPGLILALPFIAILRVVFAQIDFLKPVGLLLSDELYDKEEVFEDKFDKERFRIFSFFRKPPKS